MFHSVKKILLESIENIFIGIISQNVDQTLMSCMKLLQVVYIYVQSIPNFIFDVAQFSSSFRA